MQECLREVRITQLVVCALDLYVLEGEEYRHSGDLQC